MGNIFIYCDDPPHPKGSGFSSVLNNLLLSKRCSRYFILLSGGRAVKDSIGRYGNSVSYLPVFKFRGQKLPSLLRLIFVLLEFIYIALMSSLGGFGRAALRNPGDSLVVWVGSDWTTVIRGAAIKRALGFHNLIIYAVDNFLDNPSQGNKGLGLLEGTVLKIIINKATLCTAITDGLASILGQLTQRSWSMQHLPYDVLLGVDVKSTVADSENKVHVGAPIDLVFVGSLTDYVIPSLEHIARLLSKQDPTGLRLRLNLLSRTEGKEIFNAFSEGVDLGVIRILSNVDDECMHSIFHAPVFICPYSFHVDHASFVRESFPSKILKMVQLGFPVILIAPKYSAVYKSHSIFFTSISELCSLDDLNSAVDICMLNRMTLNEDLVRMHSLDEYFKYLDALL